MNQSQQIYSWGEDLILVVPADTHYLPGVYALYNSARMNGFQGRFVLNLYRDNDPGKVVSCEGLEVAVANTFSKEYYGTVSRWGGLRDLPDGRYLMLDADMVFERPCGNLFDPIRVGVLGQAEPDPRGVPHDALFYHQSELCGLPHNLPLAPYINGGFLGFEFPRDREVVREVADISEKHLKGRMHRHAHKVFPFLEQDVLNLVMRHHVGRGGVLYAVSSREIEFSLFAYWNVNRVFPWSKQPPFEPPDQTKYMVHGAALPRPWEKTKFAAQTFRGRCKAAIADCGGYHAWRKWKGRLSTYERAWAYYACSEGLPIPVDAWAANFQFDGHEKTLWRKVHGLD